MAKDKETKDIINQIIFQTGGKPTKDFMNINESEVHNEDSLMVFLSYDICKSTLMKETVKNWKDVITKLYNMNAPRRSMKLWKIIGDEVVFCSKYIGIGELIKTIKFSFQRLEEVEKELSNLAKSENSKVKIEVKATMWLANVSNNDETKSIRICDLDEYIGKQIDEGFRMSSFSSSTKLLLDPKIVFILLYLFCIDASDISSDSDYMLFARKFIENVDSYENIKVYTKKLGNLIEHDVGLRQEINKLVKNMYFVSYERLKGIWNDSPYPIFWYFDSYDKIKYHEAINGGPQSILYHQGKSYYLTENEYKNEQTRYYSRELLKLFSTVNINDEIQSILEKVANEKYNTNTIELSHNGLAKLYYSIACIKDNKVLTVKRSYQRKHLCGIWEFGFTKHTSIHINENIRKFFFDEFGISVSPITDGRDSENIIPLHFCTTYRNCLKHNSILCCATIDDDMSIEDLLKKIKNHLKEKNTEYNEKKLPIQYIDVDFIDETILEQYEEMSLEDIKEDSYYAQIDESIHHNQSGNDKKKAILYFKDSVKAILSFYKKWNSLEKQDWCSYISLEK